jgi:hypothetical protein
MRTLRFFGVSTIERSFSNALPSMNPSKEGKLRRAAAKFKASALSGGYGFLAPMVDLPDEIEAELLKLAFDAHRASEAGIGLGAAARDAARFPSLQRLHAGVDDALRLTVSAELEVWLDDLRRGAEELGAMRDDLARLAGAGAPIERALARFLLFEAVRANLLVAVWASGRGFDAVGGAPEDLDAIAEAEVARLVAQGPTVEPEERSFRVLLAAAMIELTRHAELLREAVARSQDDTVASLAEKAAIEERLRELDPVDAVLVRNELARYLGEERRTLEELAVLHPVLLGGHKRDALDQRISRFRKRAAAGGLEAVRRAGRRSLADLLLGIREPGG